jgi:L-ribulose-5-phosphate 3-epimerase
VDARRTVTRRGFLGAVAGGASFVSIQVGHAAGSAPDTGSDPDPQINSGSHPAFRGKLCFFSKHLPELDWERLAVSVKAIGFEGIDLTVRPKGHVLPERAAEDLPRAVEAIARHGLDVPMITTELTSAAEPNARPILEAAGRAGVRYFKPGYWRYALKDVKAEVAATGTALEGLAALARDCQIEMGFHNHAGNVGATLWDIAPQIERLDARWAGYYFDPRHAIVEGAGIGWKAATRLVAPRLKMVAVKDVVLEKGAGGWRQRHVPLGTGMVDWTWFASALADARFQGPVSVHLEYEIAGTTADERQHRTLEAASRDLETIRSHLTKAYR